MSVLVFGGAERASSTPGPTMRLDPELLEIDGFDGEAFSIDVLIEDVTSLGAFEFEVQFDDSRANLDVEVGPFLGSAGAEVSCFEFIFSGNASFSCVKLGPNPGPSGSGVVAVLNFTLKLAFAQTGQLNLVACNAFEAGVEPIPVPIPLNGCKDGSFVGPTGGPIVTATPPPPVGGVALDPHQTLLTLDHAERPAGGLTSRTGLIAATGGAVLTLLAAIWYVRRRRIAS